MKPPRPDVAALKPLTTLAGTVRPITPKELDRLWRNVTEDLAGCWIWTGRRYPNGYGVFSLEGQSTYSHRIMHMIFVGPIPKGQHTDHLCRVRECCNPQHLEVVTPRENVLRSPIAVASINASKTHCLRGHELAGENLGVYAAKGHRYCRTCAKHSAAARHGTDPDAPRQMKRSSTSECAHGHPLDETNSYVDPRGTLRCRACAREQYRQWYARQQAKQSPPDLSGEIS